LTKEQVKDPEARADSTAKVRAAIEKINAELRAFIPQTIARAKEELLQNAIPEAAKHLRGVEERLAAAKDPGDRADLIEERKDAAERRKDAANRYLKLHLFEPIFKREGYELNFGVKDVGERPKNEQGAPKSEDYSYIELALAESLQAAKLAREAGEHGRAYAEGDPAEIVAELKELRDKITQEDIIDKHGRSYPIFRLEADGVTKTLNTDIVRDLRKGKFKVREDQVEVLGLIQNYLRKVNVLDIVKPYTHDEIRGANIHSTSFKLKDQLATTASIAGRIRSGEELTPEEREEAARTLEREGKDRTCTSVMEFHNSALEMRECTYLTLDVLDVGPRLIRDYDLLLQQVERGAMTFEEAAVTAGDETTRMMREFRAKITEAYREHTGDAEAVPVMLVGGDEATIAIDRSKVEVTDELLMKLRHATNSRVVETVVAGAERTSDPDDDELKKRKDHLQAQKIAEQGSELAKTLERSVRELRRSMLDLPGDAQASYEASLNALNVKHFAVKQSDGGFKLVVEDPSAPGKTLPPVEFQGVLNGVEQLNERVTRAAEEAHKKLFAELGPAHPGLSMDDVPRVQHMRNYLKSEEAFAAYMKKYA
jgi:transcriptional regulator of met regulon